MLTFLSDFKTQSFLKSLMKLMQFIKVHRFINSHAKKIAESIFLAELEPLIYFCPIKISGSYFPMIDSVPKKSIKIKIKNVVSSKCRGRGERVERNWRRITWPLLLPVTASAVIGWRQDSMNWVTQLEESNRTSQEYQRTQNYCTQQQHQ